MGTRADVVAGLENMRAYFHIFSALGKDLGWSLERLEDVLNDEEGPARLERAHSILERWPEQVGGAERRQALENILDGNGEQSETDDDEDEDEADADDEDGDNFEEDTLEPMPASTAAVSSSTWVEGTVPAAVIRFYNPATAEFTTGTARKTEAPAPVATPGDNVAAPGTAEEEPASQASQGSQDSVLEFDDSEDATEYDDGDLLDYGEETDVPNEEEEHDKWTDEEEEETDKEEGGEPSVTDGEETQATQGAGGSDQEGAGEGGDWARSARLGGEACGALGRKREADAAYCTPSQPKRPRHDDSTSSTISTASTVDNEAAVAEEASMMAVEPTHADVNNAGGAVNALVVHHGAHMPLVPIGGSMTEAAADETPPVALQRQMSEMQEGLRRVQEDLWRERQERLLEQRQVAKIGQVLQCLACPELLVERANQAVVAIGTALLKRAGTGFLISPQGHIATCHHVLLDCKWDGSSLMNVGRGESIVWSHQAEVVGWSPTPRPPTLGMPDHRSGKPQPWLDLVILKLHPAPSPPLPHLLLSTLPLWPGTRVAFLGYGAQQRSITEQCVTFGIVASRLRYDAEIGCKVIDIQGDMFSGHSGGPVIDLRNGGVAAYCVSSHTEGCDGRFEGTIDPGTIHEKTVKGKQRVQVAVGGLHTAIPISEMDFLLGTSLTA